MKTIARGALPGGLLFLSAALAQTSPNNPDLDTVVVIGNRPADAVTRLAGSVDVIGRDELEYQHVDDTMELLTKVPGTYLSRFNQGIINSDVAIRGFALEVSGAWKSQPWAAARHSIAIMCFRFSAIGSNRRAPCAAIDT